MSQTKHFEKNNKYSFKQISQYVWPQGVETAQQMYYKQILQIKSSSEWVI